MIGRSDNKESKRNFAMNAWMQQAIYPCGNFYDTSSFKIKQPKG